MIAAALFVILALVPQGAAAPVSVRTPPSIPGTWTAQVETHNQKVCEFSINPKDCGAWTFTQDDEAKLFALHLAFKNKFAPAAFAGTGLEFTNVSQLVTTEGTFENQTGACYADAGTYNNMFSWVQLAQYLGPVQGCEGCELWHFGAHGTNLSLVARGNVPLVYNISSVEDGLQFYTFVDFKQGADPSVLGLVNKSICTHPPVCEAAHPVVPVNESMYIFHPAGEFNISGQDLGDMPGDTFFMCEDLVTGRDPSTDHNYAWLTQWKVEHHPVYGQYQNCNGYNPSHCKGTSDWLVGKEAAVGMGAPLGGQCVSNPLTGNWWSLPVQGKCAPGGVLGQDCTWRAQRVKTINGTCLIRTHGLEAKCRADGVAPFKQAVQAFSQAFSSDDVSVGGCPPIAV